MLGDSLVKTVLLEGNYLKKKEIEKAEKKAAKEDISLPEYLLGSGLLDKDLLGQALAEFFKVPYADLNSHYPKKEDILRIPENIARKYRIVLFRENDKEIIITTDDPSNEGLPGIIGKMTDSDKVKIAYSLSEDIDEVLSHYKKKMGEDFSHLGKVKSKSAPELIDEIFVDALSYHASDIHFEPRKKHAFVRFRVDGILKEVSKLPKDYYENVLNRIKVKANLRIDEHLSAQDGAIRFEKDGRNVDMRVSIIPTTEGEKVVIRLLGSYVRGLSFSDLGLSGSDSELLRAAARNPFGMILVTGPTGSGKTTTLYSLLKLLSTPEVNITSIEDPVEYKIDEVNQIQVNKTTNLTFAKGLRSIVRQDPDIILVGEIRDRETAEISVNAALTGHLLLSTFHANNAATAIPRLLEMGIEPFLLSSTLEVVVAQRLARKLCEGCRYSEIKKISEIKEDFPEADKYFSTEEATLYKSKGCPSCGGTGYKGRIGIFEIIKMTKELKELALKNPSSTEIWDLAKTQGSKSLFEDGLTKVLSGTTSLEEVLRIAAME